MSFAQLIIVLITIAAVFGGVMTVVGYGSYLERKGSAFVQDRVGPNRVGFDFNQPFLFFLKGLVGLGQPLADGVKFLLKEELAPPFADKVFFYLAPVIAFSTALIAVAVVPVGSTSVVPPLVDYRADLNLHTQNPDYGHRVYPRTEKELGQILRADPLRAETVAAAAAKNPSFDFPFKLGHAEVRFGIAPHVDLGILFVFAVSSLAVYGVVLGGWSSNSKYALLGSLRSSAQLISYEIPMGMSILIVLYMAGSLNLQAIVEYQAVHGWFVLIQPLGFLLFFTAIFAECNRLPFDLPECEQELVAGYHTEYSSMKFLCFMIGEYAHMVTTSFLLVALFLGGWHLPFVVTQDWPDGIVMWVVRLAVFCGKMLAIICFFILIRWTLLRFRFDQLMSLAWKGMMILGIMNTLGSIVILYFKPLGHYHLWLLPAWALFCIVFVATLSFFRPKTPSRFHTGIRSIDDRPMSLAGGHGVGTGAAKSAVSVH